MKALVTGAAGFIGSHLTDRLLDLGWDVVGIDAFTDYYPRREKLANLADAATVDRFRFIEGDLLAVDLRSLTSGVDVVFHQAGQPGVRSSWADGFGDYLSRNVHATQRLLEAVSTSSVRRFVYASSSSIYGAASTFPTTEETLPAPRSPYGVTKLAAEHLVGLYSESFGVDAVSLRYFTVYGPRQRPDMAIHRLLSCGLTGQTFMLYGTGEALRDFTFVGDIVGANVLAADADLAPGSVMNLAGGSAVSMNELVAAAERIIATPIRIERTDAARGDVPRTEASTLRAREVLGWGPTVDLADGLRLQVDDLRQRSATDQRL